MPPDTQEQLVGMERLQVVAEFADQARTAGLEYGYDPEKLDAFMTVRAFIAETAISAYGVSDVEEIDEKMVEEIALMAAPNLHAKMSHSEHEKRTFKRMAEIDDLTGLGNTRAFKAAKPAAEADEEVMFLRLDLDNFKSVNDTLGHNTGDEVLVDVSKHAVSVANGYGEGYGERVFRVGGDELVVLAPASDAEEMLEEIVGTFGEDETGVQKYDSVEVTLSGGFGSTDEEADQELYRAKEAKNK